MCQCAELAAEDGNDDEVILAAFFHDIGHICVAYNESQNMGGYGNISHEKVGADFLRARGFSEKITKLVESHVPAKRYLCAVNKDYYNKLSEASKKTLEYQGGPMNEDEVKKFESDELFRLYIKVRAWDELGKITNKPLPDLNIYKEMAKHHLIKQGNLS
jgi:putative nucleotidyltransferase with HDIG domain